jgi:oligoribonuclease
VSEATQAPGGGRQVGGGAERHLFDPLHHQLGNPVATVDLEVDRRVGVDDDHRDLVAKAGVDETRTVDQGDPMAPGQPAARLHETGVALRDGDTHAGWHQRPAASGRHDRPDPGHQVGPGVAGSSVTGHAHVVVDEHRRDFEHPPKVPTGISGDRLGKFAMMLAWMDLEMTGLDPSRHVIVEVATLITDDNLELIAEGPDIVISASEEELGGMDEVVRAMHSRSGLIEAVQASTVTLEEAGEATLAFLRQHIPEPGTVPLCGNSIGTDRRFLAAWLPEVNDYLHYRSIDVSTIKELARRWYPDAYTNGPKKAGTHRALDDILESIRELRYYRDTIFRPR